MLQMLTSFTSSAIPVGLKFCSLLLRFRFSEYISLCATQDFDEFSFSILIFNSAINDVLCLLSLLTGNNLQAFLCICKCCQLVHQELFFQGLINVISYISGLTFAVTLFVNSLAINNIGLEFSIYRWIRFLWVKYYLAWYPLIHYFLL